MVSLAVILCAAPILRADFVVYEDETKVIDFDVHLGDPTGSLIVLGTANVLSGAVITTGLDIGPTGTANIYGGNIEPEIFINVDPGSDIPIPLTVYGTGFAINGEPVGYVEILTGGFAVLTGYLGDGTAINVNIVGSNDLTIYLQPPTPPPSDVIEVSIDIKPGSDPNPVNQGSNGVIPVAILTTDTFDASIVDPGSVTLAGAEVAVRGKSDKLMARLEDVDGDGDDDLLLQVDTQSDGAAVWETGPVNLLGKTYDGQAIEGTDDVVIVPPE